MPILILFNKPYGVLSQFTGANERATLTNYINQKSVYAAGRLDKDSEGLLLLTDDGKIQHKICDPNSKIQKTYYAQIEGEITKEALAQLSSGITLKDGLTRPAKTRLISEPNWLWSRDPPIRVRDSIPTSWIEIKISEGKNRQVRRMTAAVGFPTLRLIRIAVGSWNLKDLKPGNYTQIKL